MSEEEKAETNSPEVAQASSASAPAAGAARSRRGGIGLLLVALLALAALVLAAFPWFQDAIEADEFASASAVRDLENKLTDQMSSRLAEFGQRLEALDQQLSELGEEQSALATGQTDANTARTQLAGRIDAQAGSLETLEREVAAQLQELWQQEGQQREADREFERRMRLLEAASLLRLGQERAELAADWSAARSAYERAEQLVRAVDDPRLGQVRRLLAAELAALELAREPDWERWQVRLSAMAQSAQDWPLRAAERAVEQVDDEAADGGGWLNDLGGALARVFTISRRDVLDLPDEALDGLREMLQLRLLAAELALVRRNLVDLGHQLRMTQALIEQWFDQTNPEVRQAMERLQELQALQAVEVPDGLGEALRALQTQLNAQ